MSICRVAALSLLALSAAAFAEDYNGSPTGHLVHRHNTGQIKQMIGQGWRPTSISYESSSGNTGYFRVTYVQNIGSHYRECRFEGDTTEASIQAVRNLGWRIEDIEVQPNQRFAGIFIRNNVQPRTTLWTAGRTSSYISNWLNSNPTYRLLEIDRYGEGSNERYSAVFVRNTGAGFVTGWGWYPSATLTEINNWADANDMRVVDLDRGSNGRFAAVFEPAEAGQRYYWFSVESVDRALQILGGLGQRAVQMNVSQNGRVAFASVNNANAQSARIADLMWPLNRGYQGAYVREIGANSNAVWLNASRRFYPSSTNKVMIHYAGAWLTGPNELNTRMINGTTMRIRHRNMMFQSSNSDANLLKDTYTTTFIHTLMSSLGCSDITRFRNDYGEGPYAPETNGTTLEDLGRVYTAIQNGNLGSVKTSWIRSNMLNQTNGNPFNAVIQDERASVGLSNTEYNDWINRVQWVYKAGNNWATFWSVSGVASLPFRNGNDTTMRNYLFGLFVNDAPMDFNGGWMCTGELLREQIRASMQTFN